MRYAWLALGIVFFSGCLARTYVMEKPRVDREVAGNRGYLKGEPTQAEKEHQVKEKRTISVLEIELGSHQPKDALMQKENVTTSVQQPEESVAMESEMPYTGNVTQQEERYTPYTIQKGDTLQKISQKFYGTTRKWKMLYEENKDVLKSPDKIRPGKNIRIPVLD